MGGDAPHLDLDTEHRLHGLLLALIRSGRVRSAHDVSDGGLAVCLAECCFVGREEIGATVALPSSGIRRDALLFGESQSRVVISCAPADADALLEEASRAGVPAAVIGTTGGDRLRIDESVDADVSSLARAHAMALENLLAEQ